MAEANLPPRDDVDEVYAEDLSQPLVDATFLAVDGHYINIPPAQNRNTAVRQVQIKFPPFWKADPDLWFFQIEAQFTTAGIQAGQFKI